MPWTFGLSESPGAVAAAAELSPCPLNFEALSCTKDPPGEIRSYGFHPAFHAAQSD